MHQIQTKRLLENIKKNGFLYKLIKRDENKCIYSQHNMLGQIRAYEVFKHRLSSPHPKAIEDLQNFEKVEIFPNDEEFGRRAWTYRTLPEAMIAFETK